MLSIGILAKQKHMGTGRVYDCLGPTSFQETEARAKMPGKPVHIKGDFIFKARNAGGNCT